MILFQTRFFLTLAASTSLFISTVLSQQAACSEKQSFVSVSDYTKFLNCVAATDTYGVYNPKMGEDAGIGSMITRSGKPGNYTYNGNPDKASSPVTYVSQITAKRYCNWKAHHDAFGVQDKTTTETGCYDLTEFDQGADIDTVILTPGAHFFLPTNNLIDTTSQDGSTQICDPYLASNRLGFCIEIATDNSSLDPASGNNGTLHQTGADGISGDDASGNMSGSASTSMLQSYDVTHGSSAHSSAGHISDMSSDSSSSNHIDIRLVLVDAPNNPADLSGTNSAPSKCYGSVLMPYRIGTYDVTASEYCAFLNAVAKKSDNSNKLYNTNMTSDPDVACIIRSGDAMSGYTYTPMAGRENFPITYVSWRSALRFCNWLENDQPTGDPTAQTTETGAYYLASDPKDPNDCQPIPGAIWGLPTEDQWYKAAYYSTNKTISQHGSGWWSRKKSDSVQSTNGEYLAFGTGSNEAPGNKWEEALVANRANYSLNGIPTMQTQPRLTPVGSFGSSKSPWGAYDMAGEVNQWTSTMDLTNTVTIARGGSWNSKNSDELKSTARSTNLAGASPTIGFRVVCNIPYPPIVTPLDMIKDLVLVDDPHNSNDVLDNKNQDNKPDFGFGSVQTSYQIDKYDVTATQYCMFLNARANHTDPYALYNTNMTSDPDVASIVRYGNLKRGYSYFTIPGREKFPITYVNYFAALRFCDWLENDQTTETGSCNKNDQELLNNIKNSKPKWLLPTEDQFYKAAYYQPANDGATADYYWYGTRNMNCPDNDLLNASTATNSANYVIQLERNITFTTETQPRLTPVGTFAQTTSPWGAYDMAGDVYQWTLTPENGIISESSKFITRGGSWNTSCAEMKSGSYCALDPKTSASTIGFRVVYNVSPPPPTFLEQLGHGAISTAKLFYDDAHQGTTWPWHIGPSVNIWMEYFMGFSATELTARGISQLINLTARGLSQLINFLTAVYSKGWSSAVNEVKQQAAAEAADAGGALATGEGAGGVIAGEGAGGVIAGEVAGGVIAAGEGAGGALAAGGMAEAAGVTLAMTFTSPVAAIAIPIVIVSACAITVAVSTMSHNTSDQRMSWGAVADACMSAIPACARYFWL